MKYSLPRVDNHGIQWRGVCNNSFIIHLHRISGGKKIMMKKGDARAGVEYQELLHGNGPIRLLDSV